MYRKIIFALALMIGGYASAHQFSPTYPKLKPSYIEGVSVVNMVLFNKRQDVEWYQVDVFDGNWNPLPFAMQEKIFRVPYLKTKELDIYIREKDKDRVTYICTRSRLRKEDFQDSGVSSRICSKIQ